MCALLEMRKNKVLDFENSDAVSRLLKYNYLIMRQGHWCLDLLLWTSQWYWSGLQKEREVKNWLQPDLLSDYPFFPAEQSMKDLLTTSIIRSSMSWPFIEYFISENFWTYNDHVKLPNQAKWRVRRTCSLCGLNNYLRNRWFRSKCENVSAGDNTRTRILHSSLDIVNNIETPSGINIGTGKFFAEYAWTVV